ncbi:hypothetical protein PMAYCL1PPCAC_22132 [Pristionchus mayeri]|uniref:NAD(+) kinase n=1 Tax=Pristionchus mayeri TaxID=1317129 RepID=A0AAN5CXR2_9BILA|nr:hypothetical protein PMAYCL1PPCAC_22132 [Pristionchus mayeri]
MEVEVPVLISYKKLNRLIPAENPGVCRNKACLENYHDNLDRVNRHLEICEQKPECHVSRLINAIVRQHLNGAPNECDSFMEAFAKQWNVMMNPVEKEVVTPPESSGKPEQETDGDRMTIAEQTTTNSSDVKITADLTSFYESLSSPSTSKEEKRKASSSKDKNSRQTPYPLCKRMKQEKKALVVCKSTRWRHLAREYGTNGSILSDKELGKVLWSKNIDPVPLQIKEDQQRKAERRIVNQLTDGGMDVTTMDLASLPTELNEYALVVAAGGDGTFLTAASPVFDNTPVIGINTDPQGSEGHLCAGGKNPPTDLMSVINDKDTRWTRRSRIKVTVIGGKTNSDHPLLAVNDVLIADTHAYKTSYYDISIDGGPEMRQKSSGFLACTGTGSTAWYKAVNRISPDTIMRLHRALNLPIPALESRAKELAQQLNEELIQPPDSQDLFFVVREAVENATFSPCLHRGKATTIRLKSRSSDARVTLDGNRHIDFGLGTEVVLEIDPDYAITTLL